MRTVNEVSLLTGVSVRTLHHYDAIGLLKPAKLTAAGYRLYDDTALARLRSILFYRELQFSLREIKTMLDSPDFDPAAALEQQITLLQARRDRLQALIDHARALQKKGGNPMDFTAFDTAEQDKLRREAKERWGGTAAWQEYEKKEPKAAEQAAGAQLMTLLAELGALRPLAPDAAAVQKKVAALQRYITENFYTCTDEILAGLGQMYTADERFQKNIDAAGGEGCAAFVSAAIAAFCRKK
ncbi:MAG: MerR family transcriptional regulator [Oscillospiraceae bacterium]|nr:MerR family transcriptional regulator [Oscillospiraceae bacterium]